MNSDVSLSGTRHRLMIILPAPACFKPLCKPKTPSLPLISPRPVSQAESTTDDHLYVNTLAKIPCIDIVHMSPVTGSYGEHHHTHKDTMDIIDKNTLKVVGQAVLEVLWQE